MADASLGTAVLRTRLDKSGLSTGLNQAKAETQRFARDSTSAIQGISAAFAAVAASAGVRAYVRFLTSTAQLAQQADASTRLYEKSLGRTNQSLSDGAALVQRLSDRFGVANTVIEQSATLLLRQGASLDDIDRALTAAGASAAAAGFDISTAFDNVATAVATGRSELLETSGIVTNLGPVTQAYARSVGKTVDELTQQEIIQARVNAIYRETASEIEDVDEILQGLPLSQARWTQELREAKEGVGSFTKDVLVPIVDTGTAVLRIFNDLPDPVKRAGTAMAGAAIGATALATGIIAIRTALTGLSALGLLSFGPAGWIVAGVTVVAGLVAVLAGGGDAKTLEGAAGRAAAAVAADDRNSLLGAMKELKGYLDTDLSDSLNGVIDLLETMALSAVGTQVLMDVAAAQADAVARIAQIDAEIARLQNESPLQRMLGERTGITNENMIAELVAERERLVQAVNESTELAYALAEQRLGIFEGATFRNRPASTSTSSGSGSGGVSTPADAELTIANSLNRALEDAGLVGRRIVTAEAEEADRVIGEWAAMRIRVTTAAFRQGEDAGTMGRAEANRVGAEVAAAQAEAAEVADRALGAWWANRFSITQEALRLGEDAGTVGRGQVLAEIEAEKAAAAQAVTDFVLLRLRVTTASLRQGEDAGTVGRGVLLEDRAREENERAARQEAASYESLARIRYSLNTATQQGLLAERELLELRKRASFLGFGKNIAEEAVDTSGFWAEIAARRARGDKPEKIVREEDADRLRDAAVDFATTVIDAGNGFVSIVESFRSGNAAGGINAIGSTVGSLIGLVPGAGQAASIVTGVFGLVASLVGLGSNRSREEAERARAAELRRNQVSTLEFNFYFDQTNHFTGDLTSSANQSRLREAGIMSFQQFEQTLRRTILPRLEGLEARVAAL